jgi:glycosyltransferase involved in cell wall biosynthesis
MAKTAKNPIRRIIAKVMRKIESILLCRFDKVICLSESMREMIVKNYGIKKEKCETHYPFATLEKGPENCEWEELFSINYQHLVYSGALGEKQKPHELIQFFNEVCKLKKNIQCHIFSQGPIFEEFKCLNTNSRILFNELVAEDMLSQLYACSDIQIVPQAEGTGAGAFPSKIPNLIAAGVPIMAICDRGSELDRIVRETHMGVCAYEWNIQDMVKTLDHFLKGMKREKLIRSKECIDKKFNINNIVNAVVRD